jgi:hypothetical protein
MLMGWDESTRGERVKNVQKRLAFLLPLVLITAAMGQEFVFGTHAGMSVSEVLATIPGSEQQVPAGRSGNVPPNAEFHVRFETTVAGVPFIASFGFVDGNLRHVEAVSFSEGRQDQEVFAVRRLLQAFIDHFGPPLTHEDKVAPKIPPMFMDDLNTITAEWYKSAVSVKMTYSILNGKTMGSVIISHVPSGL